MIYVNENTMGMRWNVIETVGFEYESFQWNQSSSWIITQSSLPMFLIVRLFWDESFIYAKSKFIFKGKNSFFDQITFFRRSVRFSSEYFLLTISFFQYTFKLLPSCLQDTALVLTTRYAPSDWYIQQSAYRYFGQYVLIFLDSTFLIFLH